jgi:hypothetical protein
VSTLTCSSSDALRSARFPHTAAAPARLADAGLGMLALAVGLRFLAALESGSFVSPAAEEAAGGRVA